MKIKQLTRFNITEEQNSWLLSYADIVTILLCFFMLYFNADKIKITESKAKPGKDIEMILGKDIDKILEAFRSTPHIDILSYERNIMIEFPKGNFFRSGRAKISQEKTKEIKEIVEKLKPYNDKIQITIIGYTDPTPMKPTSDRWWQTNDELSAARALSILKFFQEGGFRPGSVYIGGQGIKSLKETPRDLILGSERKSDIQLENYRTFSLKLEPIL